MESRFLCNVSYSSRAAESQSRMKFLLSDRQSVYFVLQNKTKRTHTDQIRGLFPKPIQDICLYRDSLLSLVRIALLGQKK